MLLTETNVNSTIANIRQLLLGTNYSVTHVTLVENNKEAAYTRSGHYIDVPEDVEDIVVEGARAISIDDNIGVYFIRVGSEIKFDDFGFRVKLTPSRYRSTKEWVFSTQLTKVIISMHLPANAKHRGLH